jgi:hypothetical protein
LRRSAKAKTDRGAVLSVALTTEEQARRVAKKFVERELIRPPGAIDAFVFHASAEVHDGVQNGAASKAQKVLDAIGELERSADRQSGWQQRVRLDETIRAAEKDALEGAPIRYEAYRNVFFEEIRLEGITGSVGRGLQDLIAEVGDFLRDQVALRADYVRLRDAFEKKYGTSGECTELVPFLSEQVRRIEEMINSNDDSEGVAQKGARLGLTAFVQIANDQIVVNRVYEGLAGFRRGT